MYFNYNIVYSYPNSSISEQNVEKSGLSGVVQGQVRFTSFTNNFRSALAHFHRQSRLRTWFSRSSLTRTTLASSNCDRRSGRDEAGLRTSCVSRATPISTNYGTATVAFLRKHVAGTCVWRRKICCWRWRRRIFQGRGTCRTQNGWTVSMR